MDLEYITGKMVINIKEIGWTINFKVMESIHLEKDNILVILNKENLMIKVNLYSVTEIYIQDILWWEKNKVKEYIYLNKETIQINKINKTSQNNILEILKTINLMERVHLNMWMEICM